MQADMESAKKDLTEKIIIEVEKNPVLYDKSEKEYKDVVKKKDIWQHIGQKVGLTAKEVESRWRNVRDGLMKYRKKLRTKSGDGAKTVKEYKYAKVLQFLIPYMGDRQTSGNLETDDSDIDDDQVDTQPETSTMIGDDEEDRVESQRESSQGRCLETESMPSSRATRKRRNKRPQDDVDATICEYLKKKTHSPAKIAEQPDDVDLFLQSMATSIRKLPAHKRAEVKYKIHGIVHEAEMQCLFPPMMPSSIIPSMGLPASTRCVTSHSVPSNVLQSVTGGVLSTQAFDPAASSSFDYTRLF